MAGGSKVPRPASPEAGYRKQMPRSPPLLLLSAAILLFGACTHRAAKPSGKPPFILTAGALLPSPRLIIGRVIAVDREQGFAILEVATDAPAPALADGSELIARTPDLRETARLRASRYLRGRMLGSKIVAGQPKPGDEVVWLAP